MKKETLLFYINPNFNKKYINGINFLYKKFCVQDNYSLEIINNKDLADFKPEKSNPQKLIIVGGDGTIHKVINTINDKYFSMYIFGLIPAGTANEFAKSLLIPASLSKSADLIINMSQITLEQIGIVNERYKFVTGLLYGVAEKVLEITPVAAKQLFGGKAFFIGFIKYLIQYWEALLIKKRRFIINNAPFTTNYLLINNASLISKNLTKFDVEQEKKNEFSVVYLHSNLTMRQIINLMIKYHAHYNILGEKAIAWKQFEEIVLEYEGMTKFLLDGEHYKLESPLSIKHHKEKMSIIRG